MEDEVDSDVERVQQVYSDENAGILEEDGKSFTRCYSARKVEMTSQGIQTDPVNSPKEEQDMALMELQAALAKLDTHLILANAERLRRTPVVKPDSEEIAEEEQVEPPTTDLGPSLPNTPSFIDNMAYSNTRLESATSDLATLAEEVTTPILPKPNENMKEIEEASVEEEMRGTEKKTQNLSVDTTVEEADDEHETDEESDIGDESEAAQLRLASATKQLHSVGPPAIIKYIREHQNNLDLSHVAKMVLSSTEALKEHDEMRSMLHSVASNQSRSNSRIDRKRHTKGLCQFCGKPPIIPLSPHPSLMLPRSPTRQLSRTGRDSVATTTVSFADEVDIVDPPGQQRYCCPDYEQFIQLTEMALAEGAGDVVDENIDINPHGPFGSKDARRAAKERAAERQREREIERQKVAAQQANMFSFARQMKTIQYSLTSQKYMDEGWTILPSSPPPPPTPPEEGVFEVEVNSTELQKQKVMHERFYEDGSPFLTLFPDGTGTCYYPSGNVAVHILSTEDGKYTYIAQKNACYDALENSGILGVFEPNGNVMCCHTNEKLRLVINGHGGLELDVAGNRRKRWSWFFVKGHVHTPPFQPLCFALNKWISVRVLDQDNIALIFTAAGRSVRFNAGAKLKALKVRGHGDFKPDESENYLAKKRKKIRGTLTQLHDVVRQIQAAGPSPRNVPSSSTSPRKHRDLPRFAAQKKPLPALGEQSKTSVVVN